MSTHIFREYDIRGVADRDLTDDVVFAIGRGLADMLRPTGASSSRIVVGRDCRLSGPRLFEALSRGLREGGSDVIDIGVGPTPQMYFAVHHLKADGGVMITGSHNPKDENGFKIMIGTGSFFGQQIQELATKIQTQAFATTSRQGTLETTDVSKDYLAALTRDIRLDNRDVRVVVDAGNGAAGPLGTAALKALGLQPTELFCEMDGTFPNHHPDPTEPEALQTLIATVKETGAQVGLAWDGDGDRLGVVDASGEIVWGDRLLALFARDALPSNPGGSVIADVKCSGVLFEDIERHGGDPIMWKTGHSLIKSKMKETRALMAGEMSGHFFFADRYFGYDDGLYAALRLVEILAKEQQSVVQLLEDLPKPHVTPELRMDCPDAIKFDVVAEVKRVFQERGAEVNDIDGVRVTYPDAAWGLVRASNTSPKLVLRFEAPTPARLEQIRTDTENVVAQVQAAL